MKCAFEKLNSCFENCVEARDDQKRCFSEIASEELKKLKFESQHRKSLWEEILQNQNFPKQNYGMNQFGFPSFTLFKAEGVALDVYAWPISNISIHSHHFSGAFKVLGSDTLQLRFMFEKEIAPFPGMSLGCLNVIGSDSLKAGDVWSIKPYKFIHFVRHAGGEGLSLVIRTVDNEREGKRALSKYFYPGIEIELNVAAELILEKKLEIFEHSLTNFSIESFFESLPDLELFRLVLNSAKVVRHGELLRNEVSKRKLGERILDTQVRHEKFIKKLNYLYPPRKNA